VPKVSDARSSAGWALLFIAALYTVAPAVGAMARYNLLTTVQTGAVGSPDGNVEYAKVPTWFKNWEKTGLLAFKDRNGDGRIQYYADGGLGDATDALAKAQKDGKGVEAAQAKFDAAAKKHDAGKFGPFGWKGNEMTKVDNDIMVLANPEIAGLPNWVTALVAAGGIAAALSTAAGLLLAISSSISHDLMKGTFTPNMSEKTELMWSRIAMVGAILLAGYLGLNPPGFAAQVVALAFGIAAASLFPVIMMGIFSKRVNSAGAIVGMLTGLIVTVLYIFWYKGFFFFPGTEMLPNKPEFWLLGISPEAFGAVGAILNFIVAYAVSLVTAPPPQHIQDLIESIRVPRGAGAATDH
jgi:cation/acetate symporter